MGNFKLVLNLVGKKGVYLLLIILLSSIVELSSVYIISNFLENVTLIKQNNNIILSGFEFKFLTYAITCGILLIFFMLISSYSIYTINKNGIKIGFEIAVKIFNNYLNDISKIKNSDPNIFISKIFNETNRFATNVIVQCFHLVSKIIVTVAILYVLILTDFKMTLIAGIIIVITSILYTKSTKGILIKNSKHITELNNSRLRILNESVQGIDYLKTYNKIENQINIFTNESYDFANSHSLNQTIQTLPKYLLETVFMLSLISYSIYLYLFNDIETLINIIFVFAAAGLKLLPSINVLINSISKIRANIDSYYVLKGDILNLKNENLFSKKILIEEINNIDLKIKKFGFENLDLIKNKSYNFKKGNWYLLKGESGSGKSTLLRIILNIYKLDQGYIKINNVNIEKIDLKKFYEKIGYVSQNIFIFNGDIDFNIALDTNIDLVRIQNIKKACNINFSNTNLNNLSGGQIQRIGIARALYKNSDVIIIDEAFTGLDEKNLTQIRKYIKLISKNKIIIEINHSSEIEENVIKIKI